MARILIVDDSPTEMYKLTAMLEKHGHQVLKAENGGDGVALARQEKPDVVLMDIVMPGLNGFQATRQLTKDAETSAIPVIIVTTKDQETDKGLGQAPGRSRLPDQAGGRRDPAENHQCGAGGLSPSQRIAHPDPGKTRPRMSDVQTPSSSSSTSISAVDAWPPACRPSRRRCRAGAGSASAWAGGSSSPPWGRSAKSCTNRATPSCRA
ncbi:twitching motility protein PilH [Pseudomonas aeruginosa]|nr:twitching motility protein PilH [Pseudomonas aeruginosa]